jgi:ABC-type dipeptide/oligopeptide/nickel transport system ATPase component/ABC-type dipeptide/oligopeptide/nickel transport system permease subunit
MRSARRATAGRVRAGSYRWNPLLVTGVVLFAAIVVIGIVAPLVLSDRANAFTPDVRMGISFQHPFGTDDFGRDMLARSLVATRLTLIMAMIATAMGVGAGIFLGALLWIAPRRVREIGLRVLETIVAYPGLLITIVIVSILGAGTNAIVIGIGVAGIHGYARLTANLVAGIVHRDYVVTAQLLGVPRLRLVSRHLLPNIAEPLLIVVSTGFGGAVLDLSGLSFIGLGVQSPQYDFGKLLIDALPAIYTQPSQVLGPAVMIVVTILGAMLIGDGLAATADPRSHVRGKRVDFSDVVPHSSRPAAATVARAAEVVRHAMAGSPPRIGAPVVIENLHVRTRSGARLLHGVSLSIASGEILGVVGESGSGKSMTAMALAGLLPDGIEARADALTIGSLDIAARPDPHQLAVSVALIYQDPGSTFSPVIRMERQLTEVLRAHRSMPRLQARSLILSALGTVHMSEPRRRLLQFPHELSGGMRQRAMIAAAMAADPQFIIADEPTTALDVIVQAEILRELKKINSDRGTTMMFISHDIAVVGALCDRVVVMQEGRVVEELTRAQVVSGTAHHPYTRMLLAATPHVVSVGSAEA